MLIEREPPVPKNMICRVAFEVRRDNAETRLEVSNNIEAAYDSPHEGLWQIEGTT